MIWPVNIVCSSSAILLQTVFDDFFRIKRFMLCYQVLTCKLCISLKNNFYYCIRYIYYKGNIRTCSVNIALKIFFYRNNDSNDSTIQSFINYMCIQWRINREEGNLPPLPNLVLSTPLCLMSITNQLVNVIIIIHIYKQVVYFYP